MDSVRGCLVSWQGSGYGGDGEQVGGGANVERAGRKWQVIRDFETARGDGTAVPARNGTRPALGGLLDASSRALRVLSRSSPRAFAVALASFRWSVSTGPGGCSPHL